ncbi:hypothetical protein ACS0TY_025182 [Phlomoides rotata]
MSLIASAQSCKEISTSHYPSMIRENPLFPYNLLNPNSSCLLKFTRINLRCKCSGNSAPFAGDNESKRVIDAFFLGKAMGGVAIERIESSVGEFLSVIGRLQAEQQKQVSELREEVLEKARRAKEEASREAGTPSVSNSVLSNEDPLLGMLFKD